jgi:hypothetical protein
MLTKGTEKLPSYSDISNMVFQIAWAPFSNVCTVSEGDLGQISALTLDCGAVEYYIILPLVVVF